MNEHTIPTREMCASSRLNAGMRADVTVRDFALVNDEPAAVGGSDPGPTPTESTLQSLASCVAMVIRAASRKYGIPVSTIEAEAVADFDIRGVTFQQAVTVPFRRIDLTLRVGGPVTDADLAPVRNAIRDFCPVHMLFSQAGTEITHTWVLPGD